MAARLYGGTKSLNLVLDTPYDKIRTSDIRDDLSSVKVWYSTTQGFDPALGQGTLTFDGSGLSIIIPNLLDNTTYYVKYAFISIIDPTAYTISAELSETTYSEVQALAGRVVSLEADRSIFTYDTTGFNPSPSSSIITATAYNATGILYYEFFLEGVSVQNTQSNTYTYTAQSSYADMPDKLSVKLREDSNTSVVLAEDFLEFIPIKAGASAINFYISNPAQSIYTTAAGVSTYTNSGTTITVYEGTTQLSEDSTAPYAPGTFRVVAEGTSITPSVSTGKGTSILVYGDHTDMFDNQARIKYTITVKSLLGVETSYTAYQNFSKSIEGPKGEIGESGKSTFVATIYKQQTENPGSPVATTSTYNFATGALTPPSGWEVVQPSTTTVNTWACEYTFTGVPGSTVTGVGSWSTTRIDAVAGAPGIGGTSINNVELYQQSAEIPGLPTGTSYAFSTDTVTGTLGNWVRTMPDSSTIPTYMTTCTFTVIAPNTTQVLTAWTAAVIVAQNGAKGDPGDPGDPGASGTSTFVATVYKQQIEDPSSPVATASTYNFATGVLTPPSGWEVVQPSTTTVSTWACEYTFTGVPGSTVTGIGSWSTTRIDAVAGAAGANGVSLNIVEVYQQSVTVPGLPTGTTYDFSTDTVTGTLGSWSRTMPDSSIIPTYMTTCTFTVTAPTTTQTLSAWTSAIVVAQKGAVGNIINPTVIYDFNGATLPTNVSAGGSTSGSDSNTTTTITTTALDQNVTVSSLSLLPVNNYLITMRVKLISGVWEGMLYYANTATGGVVTHGFDAGYYKLIPTPQTGVWTEITVDMRELNAGSTNYSLSTTITGLRFDFVNASGSVVALDYISIGKYGVSTPIYAQLTAPTHTITSLSTGLGYTLPTGNALSLYSGSVKLTSGVTYAVTSAATSNGLTLAINASTGVITLSGTSWGGTQAQYTLTATYNSIVYTTTYTITKTPIGANGANGINSITGSLTKESATVPADATGTVSSFTGTGGTFNVTDGTTDKTGNVAVTYSVVNSSSLTITIAATGIYSISALTADTGTATLRAVYGGVTIDKIYSVTKNKAGTNSVTANVSNKSHIFTPDISGNVSTYVGSGTVIRVYDGLTELTYDAAGTGNGTWKITVSASNITASTLPGATLNVKPATIAAHSAMTADNASITYTINGKSVLGTAFTLTETQTFSKTKVGPKTFIAKAYQWSSSATTPTLPTTNVTYTWATSVFSGILDNGWGYSVVAPTSNGQKLYEISKTIVELEGSAATTAFTFVSASSNTISIRQDGSIGYTGPRVTDLYYYYNAASATAPAAPTAAEVSYVFSTGIASSTNANWSSTFSPANPTSADGAVNKFWAVRVVFRESVDSAGVITQVTPVVSAAFTWQNFDGLVTFTNLADGKNTDGIAATIINGAGIQTGTIAADRISTTTLSAIQANLGYATVASAGGYLKTAGRNYGGDSVASPGTGVEGFFLGYDTSAYKFDIGNAAKTKYLSYDGTNLTLTGGSINVSTTGSVYGGQSTYNTGTGFFLGYSGSDYALSIGVPGNTGVSADVVTNVLTKTAHGLKNSTKIYITYPRTTLLQLRTIYYVVNATANTFQLSLTLGGTVVALGGTNSTTVEYDSFSLNFNGTSLSIKGATLDLGVFGSLLANKNSYIDQLPGAFMGPETGLYKLSVSNGYALAAVAQSSVIYQANPPPNGSTLVFFTPSVQEYSDKQGGTRPTYDYNTIGISTDKQYYVINSGGATGSAASFQLSETYNGSAATFSTGSSYNVAYETAGIRFDGKSLNLVIPDNQYGTGLVANRISTVRTTTKGNSVIITGYSTGADKGSVEITKPWNTGWTSAISLGRDSGGSRFRAWNSLSTTASTVLITASSFGNEYYHTNRSLQVENRWGAGAGQAAETDTTDAGYFYGGPLARALRTEGVYTGAYGSVYLSNTAAGNTLFSQNTSSGLAMYALATTVNATNHAFRGTNSSVSSSGLVGAANGYAFYAENTSITTDTIAPSPNSYGPFTGSHDALVDKSLEFVAGDIVYDVVIISKNGISDSIGKVSTSKYPKQKGCIGVYTGSRINNILGFIPNALKNLPEQQLQEINQTYDYVIVNAIGEGQINVCGENGNLEPGDLIVTSSIAGKGMKQDDDIIRNTTVAKCRESVTFSSPTEVKLVSCIYLCG